MGITWFFKIETIKKIQITRWVKYVFYQLETIKTIADLVQMSVTLYFTIYTAGYTLPMQIQEHRSLGDRSLNFYLRNPLVIVIFVKHSQRQVTQIQAAKTSCYCYCYCNTAITEKSWKFANDNNAALVQLWWLWPPGVELTRDDPSTSTIVLEK